MRMQFSVQSASAVYCSYPTIRLYLNVKPIGPTGRPRKCGANEIRKFAGQTQIERWFGLMDWGEARRGEASVLTVTTGDTIYFVIMHYDCNEIRWNRPKRPRPTAFWNMFAYRMAFA